MYYYTIGGLNFSSDFSIYGINKSLIDLKPDFTIKRGLVREEGIKNPRVKGKICHIKEDKIWLNISGVARFLVSEGKSIKVDSQIDMTSPLISLYLLGSSFGALLQQRNILAVHGSTVVINGQAHIFCGPSGIGKSTLAAGFYKKGFEIYSDDISVVDSKGYVYPSTPQIHLLKTVLRN